MKIFASEPVMLQDADLDYITGGVGNVTGGAINISGNAFQNSEQEQQDTNVNFGVVVSEG
jgi:hypothetical protein